jgi:hypothetical protein
LIFPFAYAVEVHRILTFTALHEAGLEVPADPIDPNLPVLIRQGIDDHGRLTPELHDTWVARYPSGTFDVWAEKELLLLSPAATVEGIDTTTVPPDSSGAAPTLLSVASVGATQPDNDFRNRDRLAYDADRKPLVDSFGRQVAADPALLNLGKLGVLSSQAHAHYGLADVQFSDDPEVLKSDPRRFAVASAYPKGPILSIAAEMAQEHMDLALLAGLSDLPGAQTLCWEHSGQGLHYLEDVGNPIHAVQVGLYDFFVDAYVQHLEHELLTAGGYAAPLQSFPSVGMQILTNHHTISEELTRKRIVEAFEGKGTPDATRLLTAMQTDDPAFAAKLDGSLALLGPNPENDEFARVITETLIEASSYEGDDVYRATRAIADPKWRKYGEAYDYDHDDPDLAVVPMTPTNAADYATFWRLQEEAFGRTGTAIRRWQLLQDRALDAAMGDPERKDQLKHAVQDRLIRRQTRMLSEAEARRADWLANPPADGPDGEHLPEVLGGEIAAGVVVVGIIGGVGLLMSRRKRKV